MKWIDSFKVETMAKYLISAQELTRDNSTRPRANYLMRAVTEAGASCKLLSVLFLSLSRAGQNVLMDNSVLVAK